MNQVIRSWIETHYQPWRTSPNASVLRGPVASTESLPLNDDAQAYFARRGVAPEGRYYEDLLEAELFEILDTISSWLSEADQGMLDESAAFGSSQTTEPNACAMECLDGYAILFDYSFDAVLISSTELYMGLLLPPRVVSPETFPLALNTTILSMFFRVADPWTPIPDSGFAHRALVDRWVWLMTLFLVGHEVSHVVLNHLADAPVRYATVGTITDHERVAVLRPEMVQEFEADQNAIELMLRGESAGGLIAPGGDRGVFWNAAYGTLGWLFTVFEAVEILTQRIGLPATDTHPPAAERWSRIETVLRRHVAINSATRNLHENMRGNACRSAETGELPELWIDRRGRNDDYVPLPYSALLSQFMHARRRSIGGARE